MPSPIHGCACGSCDIAAASGRLTAATIRKGPSCGSSCRWRFIRARTAGIRCHTVLAVGAALRPLLDQTTLQPDAVSGDTKGRIAQLMMMVAFGRNAEAALDRAREARFASPSSASIFDHGIEMMQLDPFRQFGPFFFTQTDHIELLHNHPS